MQRRNDLLATLQKHNRGIRSLEIREKDGTLAFTKEQEVPSKQQCLDGLAAIWIAKSEALSCMMPHELLADLDAALQFEVDIVAARIFMLTPQYWGTTFQEVLQTGWSWTVLHRLNCGLVPYGLDTPLSTLSVAVGAICDMLQRAVMCAQSVGKHSWRASQAEPNTATRASQQSTDSGYTYGQVSSAGLPALSFTEESPPPLNARSTDSTYVEEDALGAETRRLSHPPDAVPMQGAYIDGPAFTSSAGDSSAAKPCYNLANTGFCKFGNKCKFSHDVAAGQGIAVNNDGYAAARVDKRTTMPCNNFKKFSSCRKVNCPYMHPPGTHIVDYLENVITLDDLQSQPQANRQCRNEQSNGLCMKSHCRFDHQFPHGVGTTQLDQPSSSSENLQNQQMTQTAKQCWNERDKGRCIKHNCIFAHQLPQGPIRTNSNNTWGIVQQQQQSRRRKGRDGQQTQMTGFASGEEQNMGNGLSQLSHKTMENHFQPMVQSGNGGRRSRGRRRRRS